MKKFIGILIVSSVIILAGCTMTNEINTNTTTIIDYSGEFIVAGIGPDISFEPTATSNDLVLKKTYEDHTDHLFFSRSFWDNYLDISQDCVPGNIINFEGKVKALDAAAGNHYYEIIETNNLEKIGGPTQDEVLKILERYNYCEKDKNCSAVYGKCPLPCHIGVNNKFTETVENIINNFWENQESQCMYRCMEIKNVKCENYRCIVK